MSKTDKLQQQLDKALAVLGAQTKPVRYIVRPAKPRGGKDRTKRAFAIREDLVSRPLLQQVEILWISGPTWHDAQQIAQRLGLTVQQVQALVKQLPQRRGGKVRTPRGGRLSPGVRKSLQYAVAGSRVGWGRDNNKLTDAELVAAFVRTGYARTNDDDKRLLERAQKQLGRRGGKRRDSAGGAGYLVQTMRGSWTTVGRHATLTEAYHQALQYQQRGIVTRIKHGREVLWKASWGGGKARAAGKTRAYARIPAGVRVSRDGAVRYNGRLLGSVADEYDGTYYAFGPTDLRISENRWVLRSDAVRELLKKHRVKMVVR